MNCSRIDGNRVKNRFADLFFAFTSIFDLLSHLRQQKRHPCGCLFCWLGLASIRTEPRTRRRCTFAARRSTSLLVRRRACESRSEADTGQFIYIIYPLYCNIRHKNTAIYHSGVFVLFNIFFCIRYSVQIV